MSIEALEGSRTVGTVRVKGDSAGSPPLTGGAVATAGIALSLLAGAQPHAAILPLEYEVAASDFNSCAASDQIVIWSYLHASGNSGEPGAFVEAERVWFYRYKRSLMGPYKDKYVAVYRGSVVDFDKNLASLVNRFFSNYGPVEAFFGFVGREPPGAVAGLTD